MEKLPVREKVCYAFGDVASCIIWSTVMFFLPKFYTDTFGIPAMWAGWMFLGVRVWDAINDPMMGVIADRTKTRWGKFRPYLLWMAVPFGIGGILMFITPNFAVVNKFIYACITYAVMMTVYTAINIPYSALSGVMSSNPLERTVLSSFRFAGAFAGNLLVQALTLPLVEFFGGGDDAKGFQITMTLFAVVCTCLFFVAFAFTKERVEPPAKQKSSVGQDLLDLLKNPPWIVLALLSLATLVYVAMRSAVILFYFDYYVGKKMLATPFMVSGTVTIILALSMTKWLTRTFGKRRCYVGCMLVAALSSVAFYFARPDDIVYLFIVQIIFSIPSGLTMPLLWSMYADAADYGEWKNGRRATGLVFSAATFAQKSGFAIGGWLAMVLLSFYGYEPNVPQTDRALHGIRMMLSIYPAIGATIAAMLVWFYPLKEETLGQIETELTARRVESGDEPAEG